MSADRTNRFLTTYNRLDELLRARLRADAQRSHAKLIEQVSELDPVVRSVASRLQAFRALRNAIVHVAPEGGTEPIADPHGTVVEEYERILSYILEPPSALLAMATRATDVKTACWDTPLLQVITELSAHGWDTVPILDTGRLSGIYTLRGLQAWLVDQADRLLDLRTLHFSDMKSHVSFDTAAPNKERRTLRDVCLVGESATIEEVEGLFRSRSALGEYLSVVCITKTGRVGEDLLGIVTPSDLPSANPVAFAQRVAGSASGTG